MCVIVFSEKGKEAPTEEQIRKMFNKNPDGAGFAYNDPKDKNKVKFEKGFMTVGALLERIKPLEQWKDTNFAIHFRIGTAGKNDAATCHPFKISNKFNVLRETKGEGAVLFHNGVLDKGGYADPLSSDTQDFVIAMAPLLEKYNKSKTRDRVIEYATEGNRLLLMYEGNKFKLFGDWKKSDEGDLWVSNKLWETTSYGTWYGGYTNYGAYGYGAYGFDDWSDDREYETSKKEDKKEDKKKKLEKLTEDEMRRLWRELEINGYAWFANEKQMHQMMNDADALHGNMATKNTFTYVFDEEQLIAYDIDMEDDLLY